MLLLWNITRPLVILSSFRVTFFWMTNDDRGVPCVMGMWTGVFSNRRPAGGACKWKSRAGLCASSPEGSEFWEEQERLDWWGGGIVSHLLGVWHVTVGLVGKNPNENHRVRGYNWRGASQGCVIVQNTHKNTWRYVMFKKTREKNNSTQIIYSTPPPPPPPPGPRPLTTAVLIPALSRVLVLPTVLPGIPGRGGALNLEKQARGEWRSWPQCGVSVSHCFPCALTEPFARFGAHLKSI